MGIPALAIWLESGSPILFRQERIGLGGRPFQILKFRSMNHDAEEHGPKWAADGDHRVTHVGRIIQAKFADDAPHMSDTMIAIRRPLRTMLLGIVIHGAKL